LIFPSYRLFTGVVQWVVQACDAETGSPVSTPSQVVLKT